MMYVAKSGNAVYVEDYTGDRLYVDRMAKWGEDDSRVPVFEFATKGVPLLTLDQLRVLRDQLNVWLEREQ